ncbi:zinc finger protein 878-like [Drosophila innubila]|uniref:zinc finger protein 878-like n=1 Tax=Drosophila innubila TaxID=198719 RepID=UPI00148B9663|nr:zinc finger protein 878-like [Drosophila innubila]
MPPHFERCGDIVWQCKRDSRSFAFKCIFCEHQSTAFRDFKVHLEGEHSVQMELDVQQEPIKTKTRRLRSQREKQTALITTVQLEMETTESKLDMTELQLDPLEKSEVLTAAVKPEFESEPESERMLDMPSDRSIDGDSDSLETVPSSSSYFWLRQHPIMLSLIEQYKEARLLWDMGMLEYRNYKRRGDACDQIAAHLNAQFDLQLKGLEIADYTKRLRYAYEVEQRRLQRNEDAVATKWYYEHLSFLCNSVRGKRGKEDRKGGQREDSMLPVPQLTDEQNVKFIELYQRCNRLWDMQDLTCRLRHVRVAAKKTLLQLCRSELQVPLEPAQLQRYIRHMRKAYAQEKSRRIECKRKGIIYKCRGRYQQQLQFLDEHMPPFQCQECGELLSSMDRFKVHCAAHDGSLPFVCPFCKRGFTRSDNCIMHVRRHTQDFHLECKECGKRFANTSDLQVHRRQHTGEKPYCCDVCGSRFTTCSFFERHKRRHEKRPTGKCHLCDKVFYENSLLNDHIKGHLNVRDKKCDICNKSFTSAKYLRQHKEIHAAHKRYICKICGKGFAQYAGLSGHMKSHGTTVRGGTKEETQTKAISTSPTDPSTTGSL